MRRRHFLASLGCAAIAASAVALAPGFASAQFRPAPRGPEPRAAERPGSWTLLGTQSVGFRIDRDVIRVGRQDGRFRAIKLRARGNDIEVLDLKVIYGNGQTEDLRVRHFMRKGSETRAIDLRGNTRFIREVQMVYKSRPNFRGRATVELWGLH